MERSRLLLNGLKKFLRKSSSSCEEALTGKSKAKGPIKKTDCEKPDPCKTGPTSGGEDSKPPASQNSWRFWKRISLFTALPTIGALSAAVILMHKEAERPEFVPYEHLRLRHKKFPWGDGNKSFFHNPRVNALPEGYEDQLEAGKEDDEEDDDKQIEKV